MAYGKVYLKQSLKVLSLIIILMLMTREPKNDKTIRDYWKQAQQRHREKEKAEAATIEPETAQAQATPTIEGVTSNE